MPEPDIIFKQFDIYYFDQSSFTNSYKMCPSLTYWVYLMSITHVGSKQMVRSVHRTRCALNQEPLNSSEMKATLSDIPSILKVPWDFSLTEEGKAITSKKGKQEDQRQVRRIMNQRRKSMRKLLWMTELYWMTKICPLQRQSLWSKPTLMLCNAYECRQCPIRRSNQLWPNVTCPVNA